jgi:hypothetical protein
MSATLLPEIRTSKISSKGVYYNPYFKIFTLILPFKGLKGLVFRRNIAAT